MRRLLSLLVAAMLFAFIITPASAQGDAKKTVAEILKTATENKTAPQFTILMAALKAADPSLLDGLSKPGAFTVFAPTDKAFTAALDTLKLKQDQLLGNKELLTQILRYHLLPDTFTSEDMNELIGTVYYGTMLDASAVKIVTTEAKKITIDKANVQQTDLVASNGVIHIIDAVLIPQQGDSVAFKANPPTPALVGKQTLMGVLEGRKDTTKMVAMLKALKFDEVLKGNISFTIFAPTDAAVDEFVKQLDGATFEDLLKSTDTLAKLVTFHVIPGRLTTTDLLGFIKPGEKTAAVATDLSGSVLLLFPSGNTLTVGTVKVIESNIAASNGMVHIVDQVLLP